MEIVERPQLQKYRPRHQLLEGHGDWSGEIGRIQFLARYHAGTTTMSDLLDAQTLYQQSRDKFVETYARYQVRIVEDLQSTGR